MVCDLTVTIPAFFFEGHCYGCRNNGNLKTKHPKNTRAYIGGHVDGVLPFGMDDFSDDDEDVR
jgi:hypothetical protein